MKMFIQGDMLVIETEKPQDFYLIGRLSASFARGAVDYPAGQKTVEIPMAEVLKELAE